MRDFRILLLAILLLAGCVEADPPPPPVGVCRVETRAELPLRVVRNFLLIPASLDSRKVQLVVDTGAEATTLTPDAAGSLGLTRDHAHGTVLVGVAGSVRSDNARVDMLTLGDLRRRNLSLAVGAIPSFPGADPPVAGLLGADMLAGYDLDIDMRTGRVALREVRDCPNFAPWGRVTDGVPVSRTESGLAFVPVLLNGHTVHALIDTGARTTLVTRRVAQALGVTAEALQNDPARAGLGVGLGNILFRQHRFAELRLGPLVLHDIEANVADPHLPGVDMLLGADILAGRRIWISAASGRLFVR